MATKYSGSPFVEWRKKAGIAATELALALSISKTHLSDLERATADISPNILRKLSEMGIDAEKFHAKHKAWMDERRAAVMEKLNKVEL